LGWQGAKRTSWSMVRGLEPQIIAIGKQKIDYFNLVAFLSSSATISKGQTKRSVIPPLQIIGRLTFLTPNLITRLIQKFVQNISLLLSWLALSIQVLQEQLKFDYVYINCLNKTSGQTWG